MPAYGVVSTINGFGSYEFSPRLVDIDPQRAVITVEELERRVTPATRAVCYVNFSGATGQDLVDIEAFCKERNLLLIEDAACAVASPSKDVAPAVSVMSRATPSRCRRC